MPTDVVSPYRLARAGALFGAISIVLAAAFGPAVAQQAPCAPNARAAAGELVAAWQAQLAKADPKALLGLYAADGLLVDHMMGNDEYQGQARIAQFYETFLERRPSVRAAMSDVTVGCNQATASGTVLLHISGKRKGTRNLLTGRFEIVAGFQDGRWQLSRHSLELKKRPNRVKA